MDEVYVRPSSKAPFVGVNHHGQSILLGCGLISNKNVDTFVWLFESWMKCMLGRNLKAIITDQDQAMKRAIEIVFLETKHRFCLWHIMKKIPKKLKGYSQYEAIKRDIEYSVCDSLSRDEFEDNWQILLEMHNLQDNEWLQWLYYEQHH